MNNESGSALQKASFALLVLIAAALGYLIVRERLRTDQILVQNHPSAAETNQETTAPVSNPDEMKSSFAPLRPRSATNAPRVLTSNSPISARNSFQSASGNPPDVVEEARLARPSDPGAGAFVGQAAEVAGGGRGRGSVTGKVILRGTPPAEKPITLDATCGRLHPGPMFTRHFVVGRDGGLGNVFVYVKTGAPKDDSQQEAVPVIDNVACEFQPYVLGVRAGQPFTLRNSDPVLHNMNMMPKPGSGNRGANLGMPVKNMSLTRVFDRPEIFIRVKCDVHPWMFAYISVVEHRWFAVTDGDGNFALPPELPPGRYTVAAVHLKAGEQTRQITVGAAGAEPLNFTMEAPDSSEKTP